MGAARKDDAAEVDKLVKGGADINALGNGGQSPLMAATLAGSAKAVEALLKAGADATIGEKDGYTPFHGAGFQGRADVAKILFKHGLDVYTTHSDGFIGMHRACWRRERRHADTVRAFIKMGVDPEYKNKDGKTCMDMTQNEDTKKVLKRAIKKKKEKA